jgi:GNAT superfamily N-acetyltransferase
MNEKAEIRPFSVDDAGQIFDLLQDVSVFSISDEKVPELAEKFARLDAARAYVVTEAGNIIGFGSVFFCDRIRGGRFAIVEDMVVATDMRGKGIGKMLLSELLNCARAEGCFKVVLESSDAARKFYRACGFKDGGQSMKLFF